MAREAGRYATEHDSEHVLKARCPQLKLQRREKTLMDLPPFFELCSGEEATSVSKTVINKDAGSISFEQTVTTTVRLQKKKRPAGADDHDHDHDRRLGARVLVERKKGAGSRVAKLWVRGRPPFHT